MEYSTQSILTQFEVIQKSMTRASLYFETELDGNPEIKEVILYELIKSHKQIENLIREIDPERFGMKKQSKVVTWEPPLKIESLRVCKFCGDPKCHSDHK